MAAYLDGSQWSCHGPSEALKEAQSELNRLMAGAGRPPLQRQDGGGSEARAHTYHIHGDISVLSAKRELVRLQEADVAAARNASRRRQWQVLLTLEEAEQQKEHAALRSREAAEWALLAAGLREGLDACRRRRELAEAAENEHQRMLQYPQDQADAFLARMMDTVRAKILLEFSHPSDFA
ncbi:hypothetical protein DIPPA_32545 [Diplonema papillatum]|nr:hypothetical protein DIPPA_32545 [Diplonema papillatum]